MQLRRVAKIREFFETIARKSNTSIIDTIKRVGHSLDDASLGIAIFRRGKHISLLSWDEVSEEPSNRTKFKRAYSDLRSSKSLTSLITSDISYDTNGTNDYDSISNDLSVAEKSMKILDITAEHVMDARARIQERSYWEERDTASKISDPMQKMMLCFPLENDAKEAEVTSRDRQTEVDDEEVDKVDDQGETVDVTLEKKDTTGGSPMKEEEEKDDCETVLQDREEEIFTDKPKEVVNFQPLQNGHITSDEVKNHVTPVNSLDFYAASREEREEIWKTPNIAQYSSSVFEGNMKAEPCPSFVQDMEAKLRSVPVNHEYKWIDEADQARHPQRVETKSASSAINANRKEHFRSSKMAVSTCHCASIINIDTQMNKEQWQLNNLKDNNVGRDIDRKQAHQECSENRLFAWNSMSLAQTAHFSGYEKRFVATNKSLVCEENVKSVQTEISSEPEDSSSRRHRLKYAKQTQHTQSFDFRSIKDLESFRKKNYTKFKKRDTIQERTLEVSDFILLKDEKQAKKRNRYDFPPSRNPSLEEREAIELRTLRAYNEQTLLEDKKNLEAKKRYDSSLNHERTARGLEVPQISDLNGEDTETIAGDKLPTNCKQLIEKWETLAAYNKFISSDHGLAAGGKHDSEHAASSTCEKDIKVPSETFNLSEAGNVSDCPTEVGIVSHLPETRDNANSDFTLNDHNERHRRASLSLREITRNIEWAPHPRGITLINKSLQGELSEDERLREIQQRDIVNSNTVSLLHNAFFFKPEIIMRIFRRPRTGLEESRSSFQTQRPGNSNAEFICRVNNEMHVQDRDSLLRFDFERITNRSNLSHPLLLDVNSNHIAEEGNGHDLFAIFIDQQESPGESETAIIEDSTESQRDERLNVENVPATNVLVLDANCRQRDNATNDNLSVQLIINLLRNFGIEMSEENMRDVSTEQIEEPGNMSNVIRINDFPSHSSNMNDISYDEGNNTCHTVSLSQSSYSNDENKQILYSSNNDSENPDIVSTVNSLEHDNYYDLQDDKYLSAVNINFQDKTSEHNLSFINVDNDLTSRSSNFDNNNNNDNDDYQLVKLNNKTEENTFISENSTETSSPNTLSFIKSYDCQTSILKSSNQELQKLTQISDEQITSEDEGRKSIPNLGIKSNDTILQSRNVGNLRLTTTHTTQSSVKSDGVGRDIYERPNKFSIDHFPKIFPSDESDVNSLYEKGNNSSEPTVNEGSLMEDFSNETMPPRTSSYIVTDNSPLFR